MKAYVAGKITGNDKYKEQFQVAAENLIKDGYVVMSPACMGDGFDQQDYLHICMAMIDVCDAVAFLPNWIDSKGAHLEMGYAMGKDKIVIHLD